MVATLQEEPCYGRQERRRTAIGAVLAVVWLTLVGGCLAELRVYDTAPTGRAALAPICCQALHDVMGQIDKTYRRAQRMPVRRMRDRKFAIMEEHARRIAGHASEIMDSADLTNSNAEDNATFGRLASLLATNAASLADAAAAKNRAGVRQAFARLTSTCNSCHAAFRGQHSIDHTHEGGRP